MGHNASRATGLTVNGNPFDNADSGKATDDGEATQPVRYWHAAQWAEAINGLADWPVFDEFRTDPPIWRALQNWWRELTGEELDGSITFDGLRIVPAEIARMHPHAADIVLTRAEAAEYGTRHGLADPEVIADRLRADAGLAAEAERDRIAALFSGDPLPLSTGARPGFPTHALPPYYRAFAEALAVSLEVSTAMTGAFIMGALSAAVGGYVEVEIQADRRENCVTHQGIVADPGERKSPALAAAVAPLLAATEVLARRASDDLPLLRLRHEVAVEKLKADRKAYIAAVVAADPTEATGAAPSDVASEAEIELLNAELMIPQLPTAPTIVYGGDITPEAIALGMADNHDRAAIMDAEGGVFDKLSGQYNRGTANLDIVLKGHSGDPHEVRRVGREPVFLHRPALSLCIALQPSKLDHLRKHPDMVGRGLLARMSLVMPERVPNRKGSADPISEVVRTDYAASLRTLAVELRSSGDPTAVRVPLEPAALVEFRRIAETIERRIDSETGDLGGPMAWWGSKYGGLIARLALQLHLATLGVDGLGQPISVATLHAAVEVGEFYAAHTRAALGLGLGSGDGETTHAELTAALRWLHTCRDGGEPFVTTVQWSKRIKPEPLRAADARNRVLAALANLHHVVVVAQRGITGKAIWLHPDSERP